MWREVALHDLEVRPADAAGRHAEQQLVIGGLRDRPLLQAEMVEAGRAASGQGEGSHSTMVAQTCRCRSVSAGDSGASGFRGGCSQPIASASPLARLR